MKLKIIFLLILTTFVANGQKRKNKYFYSAGTVKPFSEKYIDYVSYNSTFTYTPKLKKFFEDNKQPFDPNKFADQSVTIGGGMKLKKDGEFKITFDVEEFQFNGYSEVDDDKSMLVGLKANVKVLDADNQLVYSRYMEPVTKAYVINKKLKLGQNANTLLKYIYDKLIMEFNYYYTYGPQLNTIVINLSDTEKIPDLAEFSKSVEVFDALQDIKKSEQNSVLDGVIDYWKPFLKYNKIKEKDRLMDIKLAASFNLAVAYILQNKFTDAEKLLPVIKANDRTILGMTMRDLEIKSEIAAIKAYQTLSKDFKNIEPIQKQPDQVEYNFEGIEFKNATVKYDTDKELTGNVKFTFDNPTFEYLPGYNSDPETVDLSNNGYIAAAQIAGGLLKLKRDNKIENSKVEIEITGKKKPKKIDLSDIMSLKAENGDQYQIQVMGFADGKRYALVKEVTVCTKITLFQEIFPGNELLFKRNGKEFAFQLEAFQTDKKEFKKFFSDCPRIHPKIDAGDYSSATPQAYSKFMEEYMTNCCPPPKKK